MCRVLCKYCLSFMISTCSVIGLAFPFFFVFLSLYLSYRRPFFLAIFLAETRSPRLPQLRSVTFLTNHILLSLKFIRDQETSPLSPRPTSTLCTPAPPRSPNRPVPRACLRRLPACLLTCPATWAAQGKLSLFFFLSF